MPDRFIHNYKIVHDKDSTKVIEGLHFTFIELPKFTPHSIAEKRMAVLWLRFLTEINANTTEIPAELKENPEINKALEELKITGFTEEELRAYDKFWDGVRVEKSLQHDSFQEGKVEGLEEGLAKGKAEGELQKSLSIAKNLLKMGMDTKQVTEATGLSEEEIQQINP